MATIAEYIERLIYQFTSQGADKVAADMNKVGDEQTKTNKSTLDLEKSFNSLERRYDSSIRAAQDYANVQAKVAAAVAQHPALQERANNVLAQAAQRFDQASGSQRAFASTMSGMQSQMIAMAGGFGLVGTALAAFGPAGLAAAVGLKLVADAINSIRETAQKAGQGSAALVSLSEATRLSIDEIRGLKKEAAQFGVGGEQVETWVNRAAIAMEHAREGSGELAAALIKINPVFLDQMQAATSMAERLDVLSRAAQAAKEQGKDVALFWRDAFGRGSARADPIMESMISKGGVQQSAAAMKSYGGSVEEVIRSQAAMSRSIEEEEKRRDVLNSVILKSRDVLQLEYDALKTANAAREALITYLAQEKKARDDNTAALDREVQARIKGTDAEEAVNRLRRRNIPGAGLTTADRDVALQEGATPASAITSQTEQTEKLAKAQKDQALAATQAANDMSRWVSALGAAATNSEKTELAILKLKEAYEANAFGAKDSAEATERYQRALAEIERQANATDTAFKNQIQTIRARTAAEREAAEAAQARANAPSGSNRELAGERAITLERQKQAASHRDAIVAGTAELAVASARTTDERLGAQEAQKYVQLIREGRTQAQAMAEAALQRAIAEAQINVAFEKQLEMAQAVTEAQKIALMDWREAAVAIAEANSNVERQIHSLQQSNELIRAEINGTQDLVKARQAYNNAIDSGASEQEAAALRNITLVNERLKAEQANQRVIEQEVRAAEALSAAEQKAAEQKFVPTQEGGGRVTTTGSGGGAILTPFFWIKHMQETAAAEERGRQEAERRRAEKYPSIYEKQKAAEDAAKQAQEQAQQAQQQAQQDAEQQQQSIQDQIRSLQDQKALAEAKAAGNEPQVRAQQAYAKAIEDGATAAQAQQIADLTLANALADNTSATQANTEALSPYYATDPRLSHLGFRAGSSALGYDPFAQAAAGAAGPAAMPLGSGGLPSVPSPSIAPSEPAGHWQGGGLGPIAWVGSGPPNYNDPAYRNLTMSASMLPPSRLPSTYSAPQPPGGWNPNGVMTAGTAARPITVVQNFNAPVDRGVAAEMKTTAYQAAQAGMRSLRTVR